MIIRSSLDWWGMQSIGKLAVNLYSCLWMSEFSIIRGFESSSSQCLPDCPANRPKSLYLNLYLLLIILDNWEDMFITYYFTKLFSTSTSYFANCCILSGELLLVFLCFLPPSIYMFIFSWSWSEIGPILQNGNKNFLLKMLIVSFPRMYWSQRWSSAFLFSSS